MNIPETYHYLVRARRDLWATLQGVPDEVLSLQNPGENMRFRRIYWGLNRSERSKARQILPVTLVRSRGLEPPRPFGQWLLRPSRLPVPPRPHSEEYTPLAGQVVCSAPASQSL
jgi:hypothetical protein